MGRKINLPDHSAIPDGKRHSTTKEEAEILITKYGFSDSFPLQDRLDGAYSEGFLARRKESDSMKNVRKLLNELGKRCKSVNEALNKLGQGEFELMNSIYWIKNDDGDKKLVLNKQRAMIQNLGLLGEEAIQMARLVDKALDWKGRFGRRENIPVRVFVEELAVIWKEGTGHEPTCHYDIYNEKNDFTGDFYKFTLGCAKLGDITLSDEGKDPGSTIRRILRALRSSPKITT